jgi:hypothetical protein
MPEVDYEYVQSRGAHGVHAHSLFDALVGEERESWIGSDGSALLRSKRGPVSFFDDRGRARWEAAGRPNLTVDLTTELHAPGCIPGPRARRARISQHPDGLEAGLSSGSPVTLVAIQELLGDAIVEARFCQAVYEIGKQLPGVEMIAELPDQIGRTGTGLARVEQDHRIELVFAPDATELLAHQNYLAEPTNYAPAGTLDSWTAFTLRRLESSLPSDVPIVPQIPCTSPGRGRGYQIRPDLHIVVGTTGDRQDQLQQLHEQGTLSDAEYESMQQ